jgi:hypothetical protein
LKKKSAANLGWQKRQERLEEFKLSKDLEKELENDRIEKKRVILN